MRASRKHIDRTTSRTAAEQASMARERLSPVVERAARAARERTAVATDQARGWAAPRMERGREWAAPRLERGMERGLRAAAPRIEAAAERAVPAVDAARDRIVEDLLPRLVSAVNAAAFAGAAAAVAAGDALEGATDGGARRAKAGLRSAAERAGQLSGRSVQRRRRARRLRVAVLTAGGAGAVAAVSAWRRARAEERQWGDPTDGAPATGYGLRDPLDATAPASEESPATDGSDLETLDVPVEGPALTTPTAGAGKADEAPAEHRGL